jgi:predicted transposase/invertase (TIGR01784 family)
MRFLDVKTDYAFKRVFGAEESKPLLINFLNAILEHSEEERISDLTILDPYLAPKIQGMKDTYVDVRATLANGESVIIEMQVLNVEGFEKRILYNAAKQYVNQLSTGQNYLKLSPVIALTFTDFIMFEEFDNYQSRFTLYESTQLTPYSQELSLVFVELPKFTKNLEQLSDIKDKWIYFIQNAGQLTTIPQPLQEPCINDAFERVNEGAMTAEELEAQHKRHDFIRLQQGSLELAEKLGHLKGKEEGIAEGIALGKEEGERQKALDIARNMRLQGLSTALIAQITGLSEAEIEAN